MNERTILVPVDGSDHALTGVRHARSEYPDARVVLFHAVELDDNEASRTVETFDDLRRWVDRLEADAAAILDDAAAVFEDTARGDTEPAGDDTEPVGNASVTTAVRIGPAPEAIVEFAAARGVDQIVMASRGEGGDPALPIGSVAKHVVYESSIPVTVVR
ncbi:hypothetical protein GRS48_06105 [Halorubrum sp. JWXQ-INN 858]|uniref:universal stress protein n=1 Tax=Halorubrum sp. JWXQ-INN 858 TaxID=2690782 RepID=UPI00135C18E9|nr:universal stress protein [Halorubrum sp. JWXQ-INN 858]MWV64397.1 hypothetical protein [Halorubrum sp. JWXQ-INN 858]